MYFIGSGRKSAVVVTRQRWRGGFVADVSFKIGSNELTRIELAFPRQVYTLEVCMSLLVLLFTPPVCSSNTTNY